MELINVGKNSFIRYSKKFNNLPISFNPELEKFLIKKNFSSSFHIIKSKNKCIGLLPLYKKNNKYYSVPYFSYGLVLNISHDKVILKKIKDLLTKNLINYNIKFLGTNNDIKQSDKVSAFLFLKDSKENQLSSFNSKLRSQIKKGYKNALTCEVGGQELICDFWKIYSKNLHSIGSPSYSIEFFDDLFKNYDKNDIKIFIVKHNSIVVGSALYLSFNNFSEVILASTLRKYNYLSTNMMMYWEMISYSIDNKNSIFSFGRSDLNSSQLRFKKQWGIEKIPITFINSNEPTINLKKLKIIFSKFWRIIPYSLSKRFGHIIAEKFY